MKPGKLIALTLVCTLMAMFASCINIPSNVDSSDIFLNNSDKITTSDVSGTSSNSSKQNSDNTNSKQNTNKDKTSISSNKNSGGGQSTVTPQKSSASTSSSNKPSGSAGKVEIPNLVDKPNKNKNLTAISSEDYYGWTLLKKDGTEAEKNAYLLFVSEIGDYNTTIKFDFNITKNEAERAYNLYRQDYPQHFWRGTQYTITREGDLVTKITFNNSMFNGNAIRINTLKQQVESKADSVLSKLNDDMSDFEKEIVIQKYLIENTIYAEDKNSHNLLGPLVDGIAVCEGYSLAFQYLMRRAGVPCITIMGSFGGESHLWNMVEIEGDYYHIDVTADDPVVESGEQILTFDYFNLTEAEITIDHTIKNTSFDIPAANSKEFEYFTQTNQVYNNFSVENFAFSIAFAYTNGLEYASMRFESGDMNDAVNFILQNYLGIVHKANEMIGSEKFSPTSEIKYMLGNSRKIINLKTNY